MCWVLPWFLHVLDTSWEAARSSTVTMCWVLPWFLHVLGTSWEAAGSSTVTMCWVLPWFLHVLDTSWEAAGSSTVTMYWFLAQFLILDWNTALLPRAEEWPVSVINQPNLWNYVRGNSEQWISCFNPFTAQGYHLMSQWMMLVVTGL